MLTQAGRAQRRAADGEQHKQAAEPLLRAGNVPRPRLPQRAEPVTADCAALLPTPVCKRLSMRRKTPALDDDQERRGVASPNCCKWPGAVKATA